MSTETIKRVREALTAARNRRETLAANYEQSKAARDRLATVLREREAAVGDITRAIRLSAMAERDYTEALGANIQQGQKLIAQKQLVARYEKQLDELQEKARPPAVMPNSTAAQRYCGEPNCVLCKPARDAEAREKAKREQGEQQQLAPSPRVAQALLGAILGEGFALTTPTEEPPAGKGCQLSDCAYCNRVYGKDRPEVQTVAPAPAVTMPAVNRTPNCPARITNCRMCLSQGLGR